MERNPHIELLETVSSIDQSSLSNVSSSRSQYQRRYSYCITHYPSFERMCNDEEAQINTKVRQGNETWTLVTDRVKLKLKLAMARKVQTSNLCIEIT